MMTKITDVRTQDVGDGRRTVKTQVLLWSLWTLFVVGFAVVHQMLDLTAGRPAPVIGLIIHTVLAGLVGLIVMTMVEMRLDPERFIDTRSKTPRK